MEGYNDKRVKLVFYLPYISCAEVKIRGHDR